MYLLLGTVPHRKRSIDNPRLDTLMLAMPFSWKGTLAQYCGRLHRNFAGKEEVLIYDYVDFRVPAFDRMYRNRLKGYKQQIPFNEQRFKLSLLLTLPATSPQKTPAPSP